MIRKNVIITIALIILIFIGVCTNQKEYANSIEYKGSSNGIEQARW